MRRKQERGLTDEGTVEQPYRITYAVRTPLGRHSISQLLQYAKSESLAVNQALAKIRHDYPNAVVIGCDLAISRSPLMAARPEGEQGPGPTPAAAGD